MRRGVPQNPVYPVDPTTLDVCRPKVVCAECGTVFAVRQGPNAGSPVCPCCGARHRLEPTPAEPPRE